MCIRDRSDTDSECGGHGGLGAEPSMMTHLGCGDGESGSTERCGSASLELGGEPSMRGNIAHALEDSDCDTHACSGSMHDEGWDSDEERDPELSWAVCSTACDVSGAEAGLKAMIADMASPRVVPESCVSAGKVPGGALPHTAAQLTC